DSGLDIDALKIVAKGVNAMRSKDRAIVLVTHYQRLLDYIVPDYVHVLVNGRIVKSGGPELALELEEKGYSWTEPELAKGSRQRRGNGGCRWKSAPLGPRKAILKERALALDIKERDNVIAETLTGKVGYDPEFHDFSASRANQPAWLAALRHEGFRQFT